MSQINTQEEMEMNLTVHLFNSTVFEFIERVVDCDYEARLLESKIGRAVQWERGFSPCKILSSEMLHGYTASSKKQGHHWSQRHHKVPGLPMHLSKFLLLSRNSYAIAALQDLLIGLVLLGFRHLSFLHIVTLASLQTLSLQWGIIVWNYQIKKGTM